MRPPSGWTGLRAGTVAGAGVCAALLAGCLSVPDRHFPAFKGGEADADRPFEDAYDRADAHVGTTDRGTLPEPDARLADGAPRADTSVVADAGDSGPATDANAQSPDTGKCSAVEVCNGLDDNCDGQIDEDLTGPPCYDGPGGTDGVGACHAGRQRCVAGHFEGCEAEVLPSAELCNAADDDCNGAVDDMGQAGPLSQVCYPGPPDTLGVGVCVSGVSSCVFGVWGPCAGSVVPGQDICDMADNDCNGTVDDGPANCDCQVGQRRSCYSGPPETRGKGECQVGHQLCNERTLTFGPCMGEALPQPEICNGRDDNCDDHRDEGLGGEPCQRQDGVCITPGVMICDPQAGALVCDAPAPNPRPETCNGVDDDCDGQTDEDFPLGAGCTVGVGQCQRGGAFVCSVGGLACNASPGAPDVEVCNGLDDNCDGQVDEGDACGECQPAETRACYTGPWVTHGVGACHAGVQTCSGDRHWGGCDGQVQPVPETCNGVDDDCDGSVDQGLGGEPCEAGIGACRDTGVMVCRLGAMDCTARARAPQNEICNGIDDNCDGNIDDGVQFVGVTCYAGTGACQAQGVLYCSLDGGLGCSAVPGAPGVEICNGADDDCNGRTDETFPESGADCPTSVPTDGCGTGTTYCAGGGLVCEPPGAGSYDDCNGLDDDCDGLIDEDCL